MWKPRVYLCDDGCILACIIVNVHLVISSYRFVFVIDASHRINLETASVLMSLPRKRHLITWALPSLPFFFNLELLERCPGIMLSTRFLLGNQGFLLYTIESLENTTATAIKTCSSTFLLEDKGDHNLYFLEHSS